MRKSQLAIASTFVAGVAITLATISVGASAQGRQGGRGADAPAARQEGPPAGRGGGLAAKAPELVASVWTAPSTVARTTLRHEWVDVPMGTLRLRTWVEYPAGPGRAPVAIVLQDEPGLDDWMRAAADQLALEGFIAVAPDLFSGFGPNGGNYDSFRTPDEAVRIAGPRLTPDEALRRAAAAMAFAQRLPSANGAVSIIGFGTGGTLGYRLAAGNAMANALVVFYGAAPEEAVLRRIDTPAMAFHGEDDEAVAGTLDATAASMKQSGKRFDMFRYPGGTHSFLRYQVEGENGRATQDAWPRAIAFLKAQAQGTGGNR